MKAVTWFLVVATLLATTHAVATAGDPMSVVLTLPLTEQPVAQTFLAAQRGAVQCQVCKCALRDVIAAIKTKAEPEQEVKAAVISATAKEVFGVIGQDFASPPLGDVVMETFIHSEDIMNGLNNKHDASTICGAIGMCPGTPGPRVTHLAAYNAIEALPGSLGGFMMDMVNKQKCRGCRCLADGLYELIGFKADLEEEVDLTSGKDFMDLLDSFCGQAAGLPFSIICGLLEEDKSLAAKFGAGMAANEPAMKVCQRIDYCDKNGGCGSANPMAEVAKAKKKAARAKAKKNALADAAKLAAAATPAAKARVKASLAAKHHAAAVKKALDAAGKRGKFLGALDKAMHQRAGAPGTPGLAGAGGKGGAGGAGGKGGKGGAGGAPGSDPIEQMEAEAVRAKADPKMGVGPDGLPLPVSEGGVKLSPAEVAAVVAKEKEAEEVAAGPTKQEIEQVNKVLADAVAAKEAADEEAAEEEVLSDDPCEAVKIEKPCECGKDEKWEGEWETTIEGVHHRDGRSHTQGKVKGSIKGLAPDEALAPQDPRGA